MYITNDIKYVGVNDHQVDLFEGQYVVPNGMSYNSYVILDEKIAVMDTVDANFTHEWLDNIQSVLAGRQPNYLVIQHMEMDHEKVGKAVAFLINTFNPETVIVGGNLAAAGDYIMLPLKSSTNKYSLNLVYKDTKFRVSKMTDNANAWGVAMLIRNQIIGL